MTRDYQPVINAVRTALETDQQRMQCVVDAIWNAFSEQGVSWVGFYLADESAPASERLVLGPRRDKPACSPIGLHGVCGAGYKTGATQVVRDVRDLGNSYVACDPRDLSEIVVPIAGENGAITAVLDLDSFDVGAFDKSDDEGLRAVLTAAGFSVPASLTRA